MNESNPLSEEQIFNHFLDILDGCEDAEFHQRLQAQPEALAILNGFEVMHGRLQKMRVVTLTPGGESPRNHANLPEKLGNYKILGKIGEGGMGIVLKAFDPSLGRVVAIKQLKHQKGNSFQQQLFQREAQTIARLRHDHIVQVYALEYNSDGEPFIVMEYIQGQSLRREVDPNAPWTPEDLQTSWRPLLEALVHAHQKGILHRDIKPDNLLRERANKQIKIVDFGLSKWSHDEVQIPGQGQPMGTMPYMSPEQIRGNELGEGADHYSLAVTLGEMILGKRPFKANNPAQLLEEINLGCPFSKLKNDPCWVNKGEWLKLLQDCCHPEAEKRPTGEAILKRLRELEKKSPTHSLEPQTRSQAKLMVGLAIMGLSALIMLVSVAFQNQGKFPQLFSPREDRSPYVSLHVVIEQGSRLKPALAVDLQQKILSRNLQGGYQWGQSSTKNPEQNPTQSSTLCQITCSTQGDRLVLHLHLKGKNLSFSKIAEQPLVFESQPSLDTLITSLNVELSKNPFQ